MEQTDQIRISKSNELMNRLISLQREIGEARGLVQHFNYPTISESSKGDQLRSYLDDCQSRITEICELAQNKGLFEGEGITFSEYADIARRTRSSPENVIDRLIEREDTYVIMDMLNSAIGMSTKSNEILSHVQDVMFKGAELNKTLIGEKMGDLLWYMALGITGNCLDFVKILSSNIAKIKVVHSWAFVKKSSKSDKQKKLEKKIKGNQIDDDL